MSASVAGESAAASVSLRVKRKRSSGALTSIQQVKDDAEEMMLGKILAHLRGKEALQIWVLHMLEKGALQKQCCVQDATDRVVSQSNNKFQLLTIVDWCEILEIVDANIFGKDLTKCASKQQLIEYGCFVAGLDAGSALPARKIQLIGNFMKARAADHFGRRHECLQLHAEGPEHKQKIQQQSWHLQGVFKQETRPVTQADGAASMQTLLVHVSSGASVPWPTEVALDAIIEKNYVESEALFKTPLADIAVTRCFKMRDVAIPTVFWMRRIREEPKSEGRPLPALLDSSPSTAGAASSPVQSSMESSPPPLAILPAGAGAVQVGRSGAY
eukprot:6492073-Amphidinium_carterae.4